MKAARAIKILKSFLVDFLSIMILLSLFFRNPKVHITADYDTLGLFYHRKRRHVKQFQSKKKRFLKKITKIPEVGEKTTALRGVRLRVLTKARLVPSIPIIEYNSQRPTLPLGVSAGIIANESTHVKGFFEIFS